MKQLSSYLLGARQENTTVLAVVNAVGIALDPLIIFKGKNSMESLFGTNALPNIYLLW